jgi:hypothetical protein
VNAFIIWPRENSRRLFIIRLWRYEIQIGGRRVR